MNARDIAAELRVYACNYFISKVPSHTIRLAFYRHVMRFDIGEGSSVHLGVQFDAAKGFTMGKNSVVNKNCRVDTRGSVTVGDNVSISSEVCILTADHDLDSPSFEGRISGVEIGDFAFVGTRAIILPGIKLSEGCGVAAGAVVTSDVTEYSVVGGVPAREIRKRNRDLDYNCRYFKLFG